MRDEHHGWRPPLRDEHAIVTRWSLDGRRRWSAPQPVAVDGQMLLKSFVPSAYDAARGLFFAGYEGKHHSLACIATSTDGGVNWTTLARPGDKPHRHHGGPDCWGKKASYLGRAADTYVLPMLSSDAEVPLPPSGGGDGDGLLSQRSAAAASAGRAKNHAAAASKAAKAIAAVEATSRGPSVIERVLYRQDFGTAGGWREIRGVQVVHLDTSYAEIAKPVSEADAQRRTAINRTAIKWYLDRLGKLERYRRQMYTRPRPFSQLSPRL